MMLRLSMLPFTLLLSVATAQLAPRAICNTSSEWEVTPAAYLGADTDTKVREWWSKISAGRHSAFTTELGKAFGSHVPYQCGLTGDSSCIYAGCSDFEDNGDPIWAYMTQISMVNLHILFKAIDEGITKGQLDFTDRVDKMVLTFFPWREPNFAPEDALIWATGLVGLAGAIAPILAASSAAAKRSEAAAAAGAGGFSALAAAGLSQISNEIKPDSIAGFASIATFKDFAADYGEAMRKSLDTWSNTTFTGEKDASNYTIFDYLSGGSLTDATLLPSTSQIESFYKKQLFSAIINAQWRKRKIFTTFHLTNDSLSSSGPNATRYYSQKDGGVYYTYSYHESGILKGYLDAPEGLAQLNESAWGISGGDISKASAASAKVGGFNYTEEMGRGALSEAIASNGSLSPWEDGAGWRGTWTMPVCDMGTHDWNTDFGNRSSRYGMLPCCCGENCKDTKDFVEAANLKGFQTLLYGCEQQLKGSGIAFEDVDYGFGKIKGPKSLPYYWATLSTGKKAGLAIGIMAGGFVALITLLVCLGMCCGGG